jgi:RNA polymerase sigma factor (sigma-70 family)
MSEAFSYPEEARVSFETHIDTSDHEYMSEEEKRELLALIRVGQEARARLEDEEYSDVVTELQIALKRAQRAEAIIVEAHTKLVWKHARSFHGNGMTVEDFVQEGKVGLLDAARTFDLNSSESFQDYASHCIRDSLFDAVESHARIIKLPVNMFWLAARIPKARNEFFGVNGYQPNEDELADYMKVPKQTLMNLRYTAKDAATVLDAPIWDDDSDKTLKDEVLPQSVEASDHNDRDTLADPIVVDAFNQLPKRLREIVERRVGLNGYPFMNDEEVANDLGVSSDYVRKAYIRARKRLREAIALARKDQ